MKSIFQKAVCKKQFYINKYVHRHETNRECFNPVYGISVDYGIKFIEYNIIFETDKFNRQFSKNEKVCIDNEIYTIYDVIYGIDANIYILSEYDLIENELEKQKVMEEYNLCIEEAQNNKVKEKEENEKREKEFEIQAKKDLEEFNNCLKSDKKWWQFWK